MKNNTFKILQSQISSINKKNQELIQKAVSYIDNGDDYLSKKIDKQFKELGFDIDPKELDDSIRKFLNTSPSQLVTSDDDTLQQTLFNICKWMTAVTTKINQLYASFIKTSYDYTVTMRKAKYGDIQHAISGNSEKEKEERLLAQNETLQELEARKVTSQILYASLKGMDDRLENFNFLLQRILKSKEIKYKSDKPF